jgi:hypothetical protein
MTVCSGIFVATLVTEKANGWPACTVLDLVVVALAKTCCAFPFPSTNQSMLPLMADMLVITVPAAS